MLTSDRDEIPLRGQSEGLRLLPGLSFLWPCTRQSDAVRLHFICTDADVHGAKQQVAIRGAERKKKKMKQSPNSLQLERLSVLVCSASVHREPYCALFGDANKDHLAGFSNHVCACSDFKHDGSLASYARWKSAQAERRPLSSRIREGK